MNILEQILEVKQQEMANMHTLPTAMGLVPKISFSIPPPSLPTMLTIPMDPSIPAAVDFEYPRSSTSGMACNIAAPVTISLMEQPKDNAQKALDFSASIISRQASKDALRCADHTATRTMSSPGLTKPTR